MSIKDADSPRGAQRARKAPPDIKVDSFLPSLGGQYSYSSFVPWGSAARRENSPLRDHCCWGNLCQQDDRVVGQIGRILRRGAEAHNVAQRVCRPAMHVKASRSGRPFSPRSKFPNVNSLLLNVGFNTSVDKRIQNDVHFRTSQELLQQARDEGHINMSGADCVKLEVEVLCGECTLQTGEDDQLERVVPLEVLYLQRDDDWVYVRLGQWEHKHLAKLRRLELPGTKRATNEKPNRVIRRVMREEVVDSLLSRVVIDEVTQESFAKDSPSYGIRTRYQKNIHHARILGPLFEENVNQNLVKPDKPVMYILSGGALEGRVDLYMWVPLTMYEARSDKVLVGELTDYMDKFRQRLEAHFECIPIPAKGRDARRVGAKENTVRMFAVLAWFKRGRPEQNQIQRTSDLAAATQYVEEQLEEGRNIEQLFQDFNQQFFVESVEDVLAQPDMQAALKSLINEYV